MINEIKMELEPGELSLKPYGRWIWEIQTPPGKDIKMQDSPSYLSRNSFVLDQICVFSVRGGE